ncbi:MAG: rhomboid family intramembrane serine protease [Bacteroidetes bacterium]|nr:rhomboid family intramembrane serine protease [Bacteroidota bacterium]
MNEDQRKIFQSLIYPAIFVLVIWLVKLVEVIFIIDLQQFGLQPLHLKGLPGIITAPLLHANFSHLFANTIPLFVLSSLLFYFYRVIAWRIVILSWLITGLWVWFIGRGDSIHIGASGVVYAFASFLFLSGIIRRDAKLMSITLLISFLYGGMVWGVFPQLFPRERISWESHMMGILAGIVLAVYFRKAGPQRKIYVWEDEEESDDPTEYQGYEEDPEGNPPNPPIP